MKHKGCAEYVPEGDLTIEQIIAKEVTHSLKASDPWAITEASYVMSEALSGVLKPILIPIPSSVGDTRDNYRLSHAIIDRLGHGRVVDVLTRLRSVASSCDLRSQGLPGVHPDHHHMALKRKLKCADEGTIIMIDNLVATGATFDAAAKLLPGAVGLAYAQES